ncbi:MAG: site-specific integrase [Desulfobacterium sp.]|nr:site-specific integrase [Desulfobacterium sp.]MBU3948873.1 site-specific integrase [Pseudomonadota bacterium]MBU4010663.1 site-specific integrase [Pseudomonadota bacterium]MBU4036867.1 site-specific integrase [Pseudomonadota bacterium]
MATISKRRDRWVIDFYDNQGKRQRQTLKKGTTKGEAKDRLREIENQISKGIYVPDGKVPLFKEVAQDWLKYKKSNLRDSTWSVYEGHARNHFKDFDDLKISRINIANIEKYIANRQSAGMNLLTLRKVLISLGQIMAYAVRHKYIHYNPARDAERPRDQGKEEKLVIRVLNPEEIKLFLDTVESRKYKTLFMLAIMSGARQGELLGLKWSDIDWINNQIHIQRTYNNQKWYKPKSRTSNRHVDIGPVMMKELKSWRLACKANKLDLVFPNEEGNPIDHNNLNYRHFKKALKKSGIGKMRFHDMRHTTASLLIEQGENIKYIQKQLGHSSPTVTLNVYAHLMKDFNQEAVSRLENVIFEGTGHKMVTKG